MVKGKKEGKTKKPKRPKVALIEGDDIELLSLALRVVVEEKKASTSLIQRRLKVGYSAAARLLDKLEEIAVITPSRGTEPRKLTGYVPVLKAKPLPAVKEEKPAPEPEKRKVGRPSMYTEELGKTICHRLAYGESLRQICRDEEMPSWVTVYDWLLEAEDAGEDKPHFKQFKKMYDRARELQAEAYHDEIFDIADDGSNDWYDKEIGDDGYTIRVVDHEHIQRSKLRVDARKWVLARMNPKKFGEKVDVSSGGKPLKEPRAAVITYVVPTAPAKN